MEHQAKNKAAKHTPHGSVSVCSAARECVAAKVGSKAESNPEARWESPEATNYAASISAKIPGYANLYEMGARLLRAALNARAAETGAETADRPPRILIVGAGGGQELETFGRAEPSWRFVGIDPSAVMLEQARQRIRGTEIESRTLLVQGELGMRDRQRRQGSSSFSEECAAAPIPMPPVYAKKGMNGTVQTNSAAYRSDKPNTAELSSESSETSSEPPFEEFETTACDGAACLLVLHFARGAEAKKKLLRAIAERLEPGAPLLFASLNADFASPAYPAIMEAWRLHMRGGGVSEEDWLRFADSLGPQSDPIPSAEVESLLRACGFAEPQRYFGAFLIDGWITFRSGGDAK